MTQLKLVMKADLKQGQLSLCHSTPRPLLIKTSENTYYTCNSIQYLVLTALSVRCPVKRVYTISQFVSSHPLVSVPPSLGSNFPQGGGPSKVHHEPLVVVIMPSDPAKGLVESSIWRGVPSVVGGRRCDSCVRNFSRFHTERTVAKWCWNSKRIIQLNQCELASILYNRELKQGRRWRQREPQKSNNFARDHAFLYIS